MRDFDERTYVRYRCCGEARVRLAGKTSETLVQIRDVSLGGCLLVFPSDSNLASGDDLELTAQVGETCFEVRGWVVPGPSRRERVGIIFASMSANDRVALNHLLGELEAAAAKGKEPAIETTSVCAE